MQISEAKLVFKSIKDFHFEFSYYKSNL